MFKSTELMFKTLELKFGTFEHKFSTFEQNFLKGEKTIKSRSEEQNRIRYVRKIIKLARLMFSLASFYVVWKLIL